ncbi:hypothetical protein GOBAR_AA03221 [Gossypium barbadense]|uniref:Glycosyltransferases n=1 Tax=Gossypium barbadense TaxID=3634 RepID=A0A2P5YP27_GOSBA|nr:hypothetical protein GOBAR_AA03221 [Gossypium barbadense]
MASIRRTLSPLPRQGTSNTGEEAERSVPSPLSNPASCNENYPPIGGRLLSSLFGLSESRPLILSVFSTKSARSKQKEQIWKRVLLHFFICFIVGLLIGLTPFISMDISYTNPSSKGQAFSYGIVSTVGNSLNLDNKGVDDNVGNLDNAMTNPSLLVDKNQETPYYLNRLAYTLKLAKPPLLWIVVEMNLQSEETADILRRSSVMYRHLVCKRNLTDIKDRQVHQRNVALSHIETHRLDGIIYFANEDNVYSIDLFQQMRHIRQFGTWTVAKQTWDKSRFGLEGPVCNGAQVIGWHLNRLSRRFRRFHAEMSGFAFNSTILRDQKRWHRPTLEPIRQLDTVKDGFQVSSFIEQVVEDESRMEGLPLDCSRIMVWELSIESSNSFYPQKWSVKNYLDVIAPLA